MVSQIGGSVSERNSRKMQKKIQDQKLMNKRTGVHQHSNKTGGAVLLKCRFNVFESPKTDKFIRFSP